MSKSVREEGWSEKEGSEACPRLVVNAVPSVSRFGPPMWFWLTSDIVGKPVWL
jgi:hypothetical protein